MKQPKRLTREQKKAVRASYLNVKEWALIEETEFYLKIINQISGQRRTIDKFRRTK